MVLIQDNIKNSWVVLSALDFLDKFPEHRKMVEQEYLINDWEAIYESNVFESDSELIETCLERDKRKFRITFIDDSHSEEHWLIDEVE